MLATVPICMNLLSPSARVFSGLAVHICFWPASAIKTLVFTPKYYGVVFVRKWVTRFFGQKYIILKYINYLEILNGIRPIAHQSIFVR